MKTDDIKRHLPSMQKELKKYEYVYLEVYNGNVSRISKEDTVIITDDVVYIKRPNSECLTNNESIVRIFRHEGCL